MSKKLRGWLLNLWNFQVSWLTTKFLKNPFIYYKQKKLLLFIKSKANFFCCCFIELNLIHIFGMLLFYNHYVFYFVENSLIISMIVILEPIIL